MQDDILAQAEAIVEKMGDRRLYYAGCWTVAEDLGFTENGENTEFKEVAHPEEFIWCELLLGINLLPQLLAEAKKWKAKAIEERAEEHAYCEINSWGWRSWEMFKEFNSDIATKFVEQAARELEEEMKDDI